MAISTLYPSSRPSLSLDFAKSKRLDPRITFIRAQTGNTSSYIDSNGLIRYAGPDEPRFDHDPTTGESLGLLVEESRFNKTTYSDYSTVTLSDVVKSTTVSTSAPDGSSIFAFEANNNTAVTHRVNLHNGNTGSATTPHTASFFIKIPPIGSDQISSTEIIRITLRWRSSSGSGTGAGITYNQSTQQYNIYTGVNAFGANAPTRYDHTQAYIVDYPNGWKRLVFPNAVASSDSNDSFGSYDWNISETNLEYGGNCTVFLWGAQFEQSIFVTSYIPTSGFGVTRPADDVDILSSNTNNIINNNEGSLVAEWKVLKDPWDDGINTRTGVAHIGDDKGQFYGSSLMFFSDDLDVSAQVREAALSTSERLDLSNTHVSGEKDKGALSYSKSLGNFSVYSKGQYSTIAFIYDPNTIYKRFIFGRAVSAGANSVSQYPSSPISKITYYPSKLSNSHLQTLTK